MLGLTCLYTGFEKSARRAPGWGFFSSVGSVDFQEDSANGVSQDSANDVSQDSANDVSPGLLVSLVISTHSLGSRPSPFVP